MDSTYNKDYKYDYIVEDDLDGLIRKIEKILDKQLKCTLELNFDGSKFTCKLTKLSAEDTDKVLG